jgi:hypothetical protein
MGGCERDAGGARRFERAEGLEWVLPLLVVLATLAMLVVLPLLVGVAVAVAVAVVVWAGRGKGRRLLVLVLGFDLAESGPWASRTR